MKQFFLMLSFLSSVVLAAQSPEGMVSQLLSGGQGSGLYKGDALLQWSLGETATTWLDGDGVPLSQGFWQPYPVPENTDYSGLAEAYSIRCTPNPVSDFLLIQYAPAITPLYADLYNATGTLLETIQPGSDRYRLDFSLRSPGVYYLHVYTAAGQWLRTEKIVKP